MRVTSLLGGWGVLRDNAHASRRTVMLCVTTGVWRQSANPRGFWRWEKGSVGRGGITDGITCCTPAISLTIGNFLLHSSTTVTPTMLSSMDPTVNITVRFRSTPAFYFRFEGFWEICESLRSHAIFWGSWLGIWGFLRINFGDFVPNWGLWGKIWQNWNGISIKIFLKIQKSNFFKIQK